MGAATSTENAQPSESAPSYWSIMRQGYDELVNAIIRPPRADYDPARLGPTESSHATSLRRKVTSRASLH